MGINTKTIEEGATFILQEAVIAIPDWNSKPDVPYYYTVRDYYSAKSIYCKLCQMTSYNPNDVANHYCAKCHMFHYTKGKNKG
jgi:hypothetical protein